MLELTWEQFLAKVTVINNEEARWDTSKRRDKNEGKHCPNLENKQALPTNRSLKMASLIVLKSFNRGQISLRRNNRRR